MIYIYCVIAILFCIGSMAIIHQNRPFIKTGIKGLGTLCDSGAAASDLSADLAALLEPPFAALGYGSRKTCDGFVLVGTSFSELVLPVPTGLQWKTIDLGITTVSVPNDIKMRQAVPLEVPGATMTRTGETFCSISTTSYETQNKLIAVKDNMRATAKTFRDLSTGFTILFLKADLFINGILGSFLFFAFLHLGIVVVVKDAGNTYDRVVLLEERVSAIESGKKDDAPKSEDSSDQEGVDKKKVIDGGE